MPAGAALAAKPASPTSLPVDATTTCVTAECHPKGFTGKGAHEPSRTLECRSCHLARRGRHVFSPSAPKEKMCLSCHDKIEPASGQSFHGAIPADGCIGCHDPHSSTNPFLLKSKDLRSLCAQCHGDLTKGRRVAHEVMEDEDSCHFCHAKHASEFRGLLKKDPKMACLTCHADVRKEMQLASVHAPMKDGCTHCHLPHASDEAHLKRAKVPGLCFKCHPDVRDTIRTAPPSEAPAAQGKCLACHKSHASANPKLLRGARNAGCLVCHPDLAAAFRQAAEAGEAAHGEKCLDCHAPHGSGNPAALKKRFPKDFYRAGRDRPDKPCFGCHEESIAARESSTATRFRDGKRNLHFVHARAGHGRSCHTCHDVHRMTPSKPVRKAVPVGGWRLKLSYEKLPGGGQCQSSCHVPRGYDRVKPFSER